MPVRNDNSPSRRPTRGRPPLGAADRKRILDVTARVFLERGYERASTAEIARRAHTSKQTLYGLFPSKAELFVAVISAHTEDLFARHVEYIESGAPPHEALTDMGQRLLKLFTAPKFLKLYRILVAEAPNFPDLARLLWTTCMVRGRELLAEYLRTCRVGGPRYERSASQFISFILGDYVINHMLNPDLVLSDSALRIRVRDAVNDFLLLHPVRPLRAK
ncbi:MAG: TetR/AcrR family transcriptional regulator [Terracidiphilus sp.]|nr:TetR/AcrR family transcriptional regulator [Terracidiphilus sp.]